MSRKRLILICVVATTIMAAVVALILGFAASLPASSLNTSKDQTGPLPDKHSGEVQTTLPLFSRLNEQYARGSQPLRGGVSLLKRLGVESIIDLRSPYEHTDEIKSVAERVGIAYHWLPMSVWDPPSDEQANEFVRLTREDSSGPFFVFCTDGVNRTGEMTAIYRISHDGWSAEQALKEMDELGFNAYYYPLRNYVWTYARKFYPALVPPSGRRVSPIER
jgi:protein tyrosine phosphatase (PTP) superfamily phosphohydrolase (DUF442 family)